MRNYNYSYSRYQNRFWPIFSCCIQKRSVYISIDSTIACLLVGALNCTKQRFFAILIPRQLLAMCECCGSVRVCVVRACVVVLVQAANADRPECGNGAPARSYISVVKKLPYKKKQLICLQSFKFIPIS